MKEFNYCVICGKKLKDNKKGYEGNNRRFHSKCEEEANEEIELFNRCVEDYKEDKELCKKYNQYKTIKDFFNYKHKATKKTINTEETKEQDYNNYYEGQKWLMKNYF